MRSSCLMIQGTEVTCLVFVCPANRCYVASIYVYLAAENLFAGESGVVVVAAAGRHLRVGSVEFSCVQEMNEMLFDPEGVINGRENERMREWGFADVARDIHCVPSSVFHCE